MHDPRFIEIITDACKILNQLNYGPIDRMIDIVAFSIGEHLSLAEVQKIKESLRG